MAQKINLAVLNKKKEELEKKEMAEARGGTGCAYCSPLRDNTTATSMREDLACPCASIWVVFGLSW